MTRIRSRSLPIPSLLPRLRPLFSAAAAILAGVALSPNPARGLPGNPIRVFTLENGLRVVMKEAKVDRERQVVMEEYNMDWDRPDYRVYSLLMETAFRVHPYRITPIGSKDVILNADLDRFRTFYEERYVPNQVVLACVGDFDTKEMLVKIESL